MNGPVCWHDVFRIAQSVVLVGLLQGCGTSAPEPAIDWDSPQLHQIEKEWQSLQDAYTRNSVGKVQDGKALYQDVANAVDRLFQARLSARSLRALATSPKIPPTSAVDQVGFANDLVAFMVRAFARSGDRQGLVELLSKRCPSRLDARETIEYHLAFRGWRLTDPILVLSEAYAKSEVRGTRRSLANCLRRAFAGHGIRGRDDADFVSRATRWYQNEKNHLTVNAEYFRNATVIEIMFSLESPNFHVDSFDNLPREWEPLYLTTIPRGAPKNLGEDPDR
jgi:hypothetical protein